MQCFSFSNSSVERLILSINFRTVAVRLAVALGVKEKVRVTVAHNSVLESYFRTTSKNPKQVRFSIFYTALSNFFLLIVSSYALQAALD